MRNVLWSLVGLLVLTLLAFQESSPSENNLAPIVEVVDTAGPADMAALRETISREAFDYQGQPVPYGGLNRSTRDDIDQYIAGLNVIAQRQEGKNFLELPWKGPEMKAVLAEMGLFSARAPGLRDD